MMMVMMVAIHVLVLVMIAGINVMVILCRLVKMHTRMVAIEQSSSTTRASARTSIRAGESVGGFFFVT